MKTITILGPTASGKTKLAALLAHQIGGEIISADSRQVYRGMDIGTGKDLDDYLVDGVRQVCHLIDIVDAGYRYNLFEYQKDFHAAHQSIQSRHKNTIVAGGTGMYIDAILRGYQLNEVPEQTLFRESLEQFPTDELIQKLQTSSPNLHNTTDTSSRKRLIRAIEIATFGTNSETTFHEPLDMLLIGIDIDRLTRRKRITARLLQRLDEGLIDEAQALLAKGLTLDDLMFYGLEYKYLALYLDKQINYKQMVDQLNIAIHQFAKRQMTWFRGMERRGYTIHWIDGKQPVAEQLTSLMNTLETD